MNHFVFDVESVGLHGEAFAVGYVVVDEIGSRLEEGMFACDPNGCCGTQSDHAWVCEHVQNLFYNCVESVDVRSSFWHAYQAWKQKDENLQTWADCAWPVETRFLAACVDDTRGNRKWNGPYPLHDIATLALANGFDPLKIHNRFSDELPAHNPLCDARQSARILLELMEKVRS